MLFGIVVGGADQHLGLGFIKFLMYTPSKSPSINFSLFSCVTGEQLSQAVYEFINNPTYKIQRDKLIANNNGSMLFLVLRWENM